MREVRHCEALVRLETSRGTRWTRCGRRPTELHHRLTRARGGLLLDAVGEQYHLMHLCNGHHKDAHDHPALGNGLLLDGYVTTGPGGQLEYVGSDEYLALAYPPEPAGLRVSRLRDVEAGPDPGA